MQFQSCPPGIITTAQNEGVPDSVGTALDETPAGDQGFHVTGQSREFVTFAAAGERNPVRVDPAAAADTHFVWRIIRGETVFFTGSYEDALDWGQRQHWLERGFHEDGTEFAPRWIGRDYALLPSIGR